MKMKEIIQHIVDMLAASAYAEIEGSIMSDDKTEKEFFHITVAEALGR